MAFSSTVRAVLDMDTAPFEQGAQRGVAAARRMGVDITKSARESAAVFAEIEAARLAQAEATNRSITAGQGAVTKSARESASVFEEEFSKQEASAKNVNQVLARTPGLFDKIRAKFSGGKIIESVLGGVGLGSGFAIAEKAAGLIARHWERAAEKAKQIAEYSERAAGALADRLDLRRTDEQKLAAAQRKAQAAQDRLVTASRAGAKPEEVQRLNAEYQEAALAAEKLEKEARRRRKEAADKSAREDQDRRDRDIQQQLARNDRINREAEEAAKERDELSKARSDANAAEIEAAEEMLDTVDKLNAEELRNLAIEEQINDAVHGTLEFEKLRKDLAESDLKLARLRNDVAEEEKKKAEATNDILKKRRAIDTANRDRAAFGLQEAAAGERGTSAEQRRARRVRRLEEEARRAYDRTGSIRTRDGRLETGEQRSARLLREADQVRAGFGNRLRSSERDPLKAQKDALKSALDDSRLLLDIRNSLNPVPAPGGGGSTS